MIAQVALFALLAVFIGLAQTAGVGGGPIVNIILMISMGYDAKLSISITYLFLIGGSVASVWRNATKKNPHTGRSDLNYDLVMLSLPIMSSGALFGGILKSFLSELIITVLFVGLFLFILYDLRTTIKKNREAKNASLIALKTSVETSLLSSGFFAEDTENTPERRQKKLNSIKVCAGYYLLTVLVSLLKGGTNFSSVVDINPCGLAGGAILVSHLLLSTYISWRIGKQIIQGKQTSSHDSSPQVNESNIVYYLVAGFLAGMVGATLAIGGALILIPVWLKFGVDKDVCTSSTAPLILTAALVAFTIAALNGFYEEISLVTMGLYLGLSFAGSALVKDVVMYIANKYQLKSLVLILLFSVVLLSLLVMVPYQLSKMTANFQDFVEFGTLC